ncbi:MAG: IS30 family transposase, partial [Nitrospinae bacterium]|nr:IS30 family transposase [Nitrospinota bacterium]
KALARRSGKPARRISAAVWERVDSLVRKDWSPEQISGRLRAEPGIAIGHEWIYLPIYQNKREGGDLHAHPRCQKKRGKRYGGRDRRGRIPHRVGIDERPAIVDQKRGVGDWEGDTIVGRGHRGVVARRVERKSRFTVLAQSKTKHARKVRQRIERALAPHKARVHAITHDNGLEFAERRTMAETLEADIYFAHSHASWERGLNENTHGLIRQYLPKSRPLDNVTEQELQNIMDRPNHRPRKSLGLKTPYELFFKQKTLLTVALAG